MVFAPVSKNEKKKNPRFPILSPWNGRFQIPSSEKYVFYVMKAVK